MSSAACTILGMCLLECSDVVRWGHDKPWPRTGRSDRVVCLADRPRGVIHSRPPSRTSGERCMGQGGVHGARRGPRGREAEGKGIFHIDE